MAKSIKTELAVDTAKEKINEGLIFSSFLVQKNKNEDNLTQIILDNFSEELIIKNINAILEYNKDSVNTPENVFLIQKSPVLEMRNTFSELINLLLNKSCTWYRVTNNKYYLELD